MNISRSGYMQASSDLKQPPISAPSLANGFAFIDKASLVLYIVIATLETCDLASQA